MQSKCKPPPCWQASVERHRVERWLIPASRIEIPAVSEAHARLTAVRLAHQRAGVPPWKPCVRVSFPFATAEPSSRDVPEDSDQLALRVAA